MKGQATVTAGPPSGMTSKTSKNNSSGDGSNSNRTTTATATATATAKANGNSDCNCNGNCKGWLCGEPGQGVGQQALL